MFGEDQRGSFYPSIDSMWQNQIKQKSDRKHQPNHNEKKAKIVDPIGSKKNWYEKANQFWSKSESTYDGVLSGFGNLSQIDINGSYTFLTSYLNQIREKSSVFQPKRVLDCGAGIGRIAKQMLCKIFVTVDIVDQCEKYIDKAKQILKDNNIGHFYAKGLQEFVFEEKYDCIWVQWVLSHLTDQDAVQFLKNSKLSLNPEGFIVVKENHSEDGFLLDKDDCSVARTTEMYKRLFESANLRIIKQESQKDWPSDLLDVKMYLLQ